eukprot:841833-Alexandrium_andersonii.AAC.1
MRRVGCLRVARRRSGLRGRRIRTHPLARRLCPLIVLRRTPTLSTVAGEPLRQKVCVCARVRARAWVHACACACA